MNPVTFHGLNMILDHAKTDLLKAKPEIGSNLSIACEYDRDAFLLSLNSEANSYLAQFNMKADMRIDWKGNIQFQVRMKRLGEK